MGELLATGTPGTRARRETTSGSSSSPDTPLASRASPVRRSGYTSSSSPIVENTRRVAMEAQAFRTAARVRELEENGRNDAVAFGILGEDEGLPYEAPEYLVPGTAARKNVTVRRSRDRLSERPIVEARTPEAVVSRRSSQRDRDKRYSIESDPEIAFYGARARIHERRHGEDVMEQYPVASHHASVPEKEHRSSENVARTAPIRCSTSSLC
jgi:hypothetical protein